MSADISTLTAEEKQAICTLLSAGPRLARRYAEPEHINFVCIEGGNGMRFTGAKAKNAFTFLRNAGLIQTAMKITINSSPSPVKEPGIDYYDVKQAEAQELVKQLQVS